MDDNMPTNHRPEKVGQIENYDYSINKFVMHKLQKRCPPKKSLIEVNSAN